MKSELQGKKALTKAKAVSHQVGLSIGLLLEGEHPGLRKQKMQTP